MLTRKISTTGHSRCITIPKDILKEYEDEGRVIVLLLKAEEVRFDGFKL